MLPYPHIRHLVKADGIDSVIVYVCRREFPVRYGVAIKTNDGEFSPVVTARKTPREFASLETVRSALAKAGIADFEFIQSTEACAHIERILANELH